MKVTRLFLVLAIVVASLAAPASANIPAFETWVGQRPKKVDPALATFMSEMERLSPGFFASPKRIQNAFGARLPQPGADPALSATEFTRRLEVADATWIRQPALSELLPTLSAAIELGKQNPFYLVADDGRREVFRRILLAYALGLKRNGGGQPSRDAMAEWIRTFPDDVITRARAGSDAEQLYLETRHAMSIRGRGTLTVTLGDRGLQLYVNEVIRRDGTTINDLFPGVYRVLVVDRFNRSRRYLIDVLANQDSVLTIDWQVDSVLRVTPSFVAFEFSAVVEQAQSGQPIARFAQAAIGAPGVFLIKLGKADRDLQMITAELYAPGHVAPINSASVQLTGNARNDAERASALARYLVSHSPQPDVIVNAKSGEAIATTPKATTTSLEAKVMTPAVRTAPAVEPATTKPPSPAATKPLPAEPEAKPLPDVATAPSSPSAPGRHRLLWPALALTASVALEVGSLYVATSTSSDGLKRGSYVVALAAAAPTTFCATWLISALIGANDDPIAASRTTRPLIGVAPLTGGGALTVLGRF